MRSITILVTVVSCSMLAASCGPASRFVPNDVARAIVSQKDWGGSPFSDTARLHSISSITLHHGGELYKGDKPTPEYLRQFQEWCRTEKKWVDIPYHYLVDLEGRVFEGRAIRYAGDTNTKYDPAGHALICVLGNYEIQEPTIEQLENVASLMAHVAATYAVPLDRIKGHRDVADSTVCPGQNLYQYLSNGWFQNRVAAKLKTVQ